jgi:adenine deaminase
LPFARFYVFKLGNNVIKDSFLLLSFMSSPVIPSLKLTDKGLVNVDKFELPNST